MICPGRGGGGGVIKLPCLFFIFVKTGLSKQFRPRSDALQNVACDQGLHCLPLIQQFYTLS